MKALNRNSASPPFLKRPAPVQYFHPLFQFFRSLPPEEVIKIYSPHLWKGGVQTMGSRLAVLRAQLVFNVTSICLLNNRLSSDISMYDTTLILGRLDNFEVIHFLRAQLYWNFRRRAASFRGELYLLGGSGTFRPISYNIYN